MDFELFRQNYELRQVLGRRTHSHIDGTQSTVRKVIRRDTRQIFAAKIYESYLMKARHQIDMLVRLDHPNIVGIYQVYEEQGCIILILDFMEGGELYERISQKKRLTESEVRHYIRVLVDAVRYCHQIGVIHRDIKPQNLLLTTNGPDGALKLADFGISRILSDKVLNTICGTPIYMAPQIWNMQPYTQKVDIWSIGVVTYYLLSGEHPFQGQNTKSLTEKVRHEEVKFQQKLWQSVSGRAIVFIRQTLNKDPDRRANAVEALHNIWFVDVAPLPAELSFQEDDPNLSETITNISRTCVKFKRIKKQKELMEMLSPSKKYPKVRMKFLSIKDHESTYETHLSSMQSDIE